MTKDTPLVPSVGFPSEECSNLTKSSPEYGLKVGHAIQHEWFTRDSANSTLFHSRNAMFRRRRLYAKAQQSSQKYKDELTIDGDLSKINLNWDNIAIIPKFVDIVVNGMNDREFEVKATAQDPLSQAKKEKFKDLIEGQMAAKPILEKVQEKTGANPFVMDADTLPQSDEELAIRMQVDYKPSIEIAQEVAITSIHQDNKYDDLRERVNYDQTVLGISWIKQEFSRTRGITDWYVNPESMVHSPTDDPHFKDIFYLGEVKTVPLNELIHIKPDITEAELEEIKQTSSAWREEYESHKRHDKIYAAETVTLLYFQYKTFETKKHKKKRTKTGMSFKRKGEDFNPSKEVMEERGFSSIENRFDVWYDGVMVLGSEKLLKWEMSKNMARSMSALQHCKPNYIGCAPRMEYGYIDSLVARMIPHADSIQMSHLKLQLVKQKIVPDGVFIDADGLNEVDLGDGSEYNAAEALKLFFSTGSVIGRSFTQDGEFNHGKIPIKEINHNSGMSKIQSLITAMNYDLEQIRAVTGLNQAVDGSTPNPKALVGVQKLAALSSNTATRHVLNASLFIFRELSEITSLRLPSLLETPELKENLINKIGKYNVSILEDIASKHIHDFGIYLEVAPDEEERAALEELIRTALAQQDIYLEDAIDIREIKNTALANQVLKFKRRAKLEREERMAMEQQAIQAQSQQQLEAAKAEAKQAEITAKAEAEKSIQMAKAEGEIMRLREEARLKRELMKEEFNYNMQLKGIETEALAGREKEKEDRKDQRVDKQSSQTSQLITQKQNNMPSINFESNEDTLDGIGMNNVGP